jgi:hypothetical protein
VRDFTALDPSNTGLVGWNSTGIVEICVCVCVCVCVRARVCFFSLPLYVQTLWLADSPSKIYRVSKTLIGVEVRFVSEVDAARRTSLWRLNKNMNENNKNKKTEKKKQTKDDMQNEAN